jgi:hypothetical protein
MRLEIASDLWTWDTTSARKHWTSPFSLASNKTKPLPPAPPPAKPIKINVTKKVKDLYNDNALRKNWKRH